MKQIAASFCIKHGLGEVFRKNEKHTEKDERMQIHRTQQVWCTRAKLLLQTAPALELAATHHSSVSSTAPRQQRKPAYDFQRWARDSWEQRQMITSKNRQSWQINAISVFTGYTFIKVRSLKITALQIFYPNTDALHSHMNLNYKQTNTQWTGKTWTKFSEFKMILCCDPAFFLRSPLRDVTWEKKSWKPPGTDFLFFYILDQVFFDNSNTHIRIYKRKFPIYSKRLNKNRMGEIVPECLRDLAVLEVVWAFVI